VVSIKLRLSFPFSPSRMIDGYIVQMYLQIDQIDQWFTNKQVVLPLKRRGGVTVVVSFLIVICNYASAHYRD
jgi:hypothetical protein